MSGVDFGKYLKALRKGNGISSRDLSHKVGKAVTYVSQIERGLIKNPDFAVCFNLLKELKLNMNDDDIEKILEHFNILSPGRIQADLDFAIERFQAEQKEIENDPEGYAERRFAKILEHRVNEKKLELKQHNDQVHRIFELLIEKDLPRAERVIPNLGNLTKDMELFDFLCSLFTHDYSSLNQEERKKLINSIGGIFNE